MGEQDTVVIVQRHRTGRIGRRWNVRRSGHLLYMFAFHAAPRGTMRRYLKYAAHEPSDETIGAPRGCSGMHPPPKEGHSVGFFIPLRTSPAKQSGDSRTSVRSTPKRYSASNDRTSCLNLSPLLGIIPKPRQALSHTSNTSFITFCARRFPSRRTARAYWFSTSLLPVSSWRTAIMIP